LWFVFREDKILVRLGEGHAEVPHAAALESFSLKPVRTHYIGRLNGKTCYSAEVATGAEVPEGMHFESLRQLFGLLDEDMFWVSARAIQIVAWDKTHQYCGMCGEPTKTVAEERAKLCPRCGLKNYPRLSPAVITAVLRGNQILLARAHRFPIELYSVIAGFVEPGETLEEGVRREVKEETGIEVKNIGYFGSQPWPFPNSLMIAFTAEYAGGTITIDEKEIADAGWFTSGDLPRIPDRISIARRLIDWFIEENR
jgi:NAD+ diphosphatase